MSESTAEAATTAAPPLPGPPGGPPLAISPPPGPPSAPPLPGPPGGLPLAGSRLAAYLEATRTHGDVVCVNPRLPSFLVSHPEHVRRVLQENQLNYRQNFRKRILMGRQSLALSSGEEWRRRRRLAQPLFRAPRLARLVPKITRASGELVARWQGPAERGEVVDVAAEMVKLTLDILIDALLGDEAGQGGRLRRAVGTAFDYFNARAMAGRALPVYVPTGRNLRLLRALTELKAAVTETVGQRRGAANPEDDLLSMLIAARDEQTGEVMGDEQLKDELMMLLVMGHMTTAMAITWTWHLLARHPEVDERLRAEIAGVVGGRPPELHDVAALTYTRRVVEESLRLYPPSWTFSRLALADDEIGGYRIPAGAVVLLSPYVTHRRPELWDDPERFDPDRFLPERATALPRFAYYPFGGGPRVCVARDLVMVELPLILATIAQAYRLRAVPGRQVQPMTGIVLQPRGGLPMRLEPAAAQARRAPAAPLPATIAELPLLAAGRGTPALLHKVDGSYQPLAGAKLCRQVGRLARALVRLGLRPGERVALLAENGPLWPVVDFAVLAAGGVTVAIHPGVPAAEAARQLRDSRAVLAFVAGAERLAEIAALAAPAAEGPRSPRFIALEPAPIAALLQEAEAAAEPPPAELEDLVRQRRPGDPATLVYTAGTAGTDGRLKAIQLTHANLIANVLGLAAALDVRPGDVAFSFLPLAHPYERVLHYLYVYRGATIAYAGSAATAERDLRQVQPHLFSSVPAAWKRYLNWVYDTVQFNPAWRQRIFRLAVRIGRAALPFRLRRQRPPGVLGWQLALADRLVFAPLRRSFFGKRFRFAVSAGSRLPHGWITFLWAAGIPVFEGYGLCEAGPAVTVNTAAAVVPGSAGAPLPGVEITLGPDDEILVRGPGVAAAVDAAGWLHTGDVGKLDDAGMLHVLGRREDLFRNPDGRRVAPVPLAGLLQSSHFIAQALVVGEGRDSTGALVVPDFEFLAATCRRRGIAASSRQEMASHPRVREIYEREMAGFNGSLAAHDQIKVWELLPDEWSVESGELTPTATVRRQAMLERYAPAIERLYSPPPASPTTEPAPAPAPASAAVPAQQPAAEPDFKQRIADYWSWRSKGFERAQGVRNQAQKRAWLDFLRGAAGAAPLAVLDVGTGTGFLALLLAELGHDCKGIDLAPGMVEQARELARQRGVAARFEVGDAESLAEADGAYDMVISRNLLWTLPDPRRALLDWRRVLKPGGRLLLVDGDWFDKRLSYRLQKFLGNLWIALTRLRNPWAEERRVRREYSSGFDQHLPMMGPGNRDNMPKVVAACGFDGVRFLQMRAVDTAERAGKSLAQRLTNPNRFFAVTASRN